MSFGLCIVGCGQFTDLFMSNIKSIPEGVDLFFASLSIDLSKKFCINMEVLVILEILNQQPRIQE